MTFKERLSLFSSIGPRFDGLTLELNCWRVVIPPLLMIMLFVRALHSHYECIVGQFCSCSKNIETAILDSIVADAVFMTYIVISKNY